jgi:alkylation response protein AidB-like acyl-CoA dehydrogenase
MDFSLSGEQKQLQDTLARLLRREYSFDQRREILRASAGWSEPTWRALAELGVLALGVPESAGGLGGNAFDTMLVMQEFGRSLVVEPFVSTIVIGADLLAHAGTTQQRESLLPAAISGEMRIAFAHEESDARYDFDRVATRARGSGDRLRLDGRKAVVLHAPVAQQLIVSARESGSERSPDGVSLFVVPTNAAGVALRAYTTHDGMRAADLTLCGVEVAASQRLGAVGEGRALIERALGRATAAVCAEAVGAMAALLEITSAYVKTRRQFGVPIGSFQALQHRMADMLMRTEQARSMAILAAASVETGDRGERLAGVSAAKTLIGRAARFVGQQAVQLHGGIGVTDELNVSHYFRRLTAIEATYGDSGHHLARYSDALASP